MSKLFSKNFLVKLLSILCLVSLFGCANKQDLNVFRDRSNDYKNAQVHPVLEFPKSSCKESCTDTYLIP